jgi:hypothetical protein
MIAVIQTANPKQANKLKKWVWHDGRTTKTSKHTEVTTELTHSKHYYHTKDTCGC